MSGSGWTTRAANSNGWTSSPWMMSPARGASLYVQASRTRARPPWAGARDTIASTSSLAVVSSASMSMSRTPMGRLPDPEPYGQAPATVTGLDTNALQLLPQGLFVQSGGAALSIPSQAGVRARCVRGLARRGSRRPDRRPALVRGARPPARALPDRSHPAGLLDHRLDGGQAGRTRSGTRRSWVAPAGSGRSGSVSFVAFAPASGATWRPGVYAVTVAWDDADGPHEATWHVEVRPGPVMATPVLLAATRAWSRFIGSSGVLLGAPGSPGTTDQPGVTLARDHAADATRVSGLWAVRTSSVAAPPSSRVVLR